MSESSPEEVWRREAEFHDVFALALDPAAMPPRAPDRMEEVILELAGPLTGLKVLELGCGSGDLSLMLLERGADLTVLDISAGMVGLVRERVSRHLPGVNLELKVGPLEDTGLAAESFDLVVGKYVIHHAPPEAAAAEVQRLLRPGGRGIFVENSALNPLLAASRRHLTGKFGVARFGTEDEHPMGERDFDAFRRRFREVRLRFPDFKFFRVGDRQVLRYRWPRVSRALVALDAALQAVGPLRRYSYHLVLEVVR